MPGLPVDADFTPLDQAAEGWDAQCEHFCCLRDFDESY
jgi:hypothetical protein